MAMGRIRIAQSLALATLLGGQAAVGQTQPARPAVAAPQPARPIANPPGAARPATPAAQPAMAFGQALILIRAALIAVQQGNESGSFVTMRGLTSTAFQTANPADRLAQTFAPLRTFNLNGVLALEPQFTQLPVVRPDGSLAMAGYFMTTDGYRITFTLAYVVEAARWRLGAINIAVQNTRAPAPAPAAPPRR